MRKQSNCQIRWLFHLAISPLAERTERLARHHALELMIHHWFQIRPRYDIAGKGVLKTLNKYYATDLGIAQIKNNNPEFKSYVVLENVVYNELINRNYEVYIGKTKNGEVDFLAKKDGNIKYIQVTYEMEGHDNTIEREFGAYNSIEDNYPKYVISLDKIDLSRDGIIHLNLIDFLLSEDF